MQTHTFLSYLTDEQIARQLCKEASKFAFRKSLSLLGEELMVLMPDRQYWGKIARRLGITREVSKTEYCGNDRSDITAKICDIIATHAGRRTFVVHCAEEGWTEEMIRTYTGHEDFKAMRPYFAIGDKKRRMFMKKHF